MSDFESAMLEKLPTHIIEYVGMDPDDRFRLGRIRDTKPDPKSVFSAEQRQNALDQMREQRFRDARQQSLLKKKYSGERIVRVVCAICELDRPVLFNADRRKHVVFARNLAMWFMHNKLNWSYARIARFFGKDHTTVLNSFWKMRDYQADYFPTIAKCEALLDQIEGNTNGALGA